MKLRYTFLLTVVVCIVAMSIGLYNKSSYKDFNAEKDPLWQFEVGILSEDVVAAQIERMRETLSDAPIIVAAKCEEKSHFIFSCTTQKVTIEKVFQGENVHVGDSINVAKSGGIIFLDGYSNNNPGINMGFVNEMIPGETYLLFIEKKLNEVDLYVIDSNMIIKPIFCYNKMENTVPSSQSEEINYTMYTNVKDNEYFFDSENAYRIMNEFKEELKEKYPIG